MLYLVNIRFLRSWVINSVQQSKYCLEGKPHPWMKLILITQPFHNGILWQINFNGMTTGLNLFYV